MNNQTKNMSSDGEDWGKWFWSAIFNTIIFIENQLDSDNEKEEEKKKEEELAKKKAAFVDEDEVDPEEFAKKKKEEARKLEQEQMANARTKKTNKIDYDKAFEARQAKLGGATKVEETKDVAGMSKAAKGMMMEQA